jgi:hypothetical protein
MPRNLKTGGVELKRRNAKTFKGVIGEDKRFLCALASLRFNPPRGQVHSLTNLHNLRGRADRFPDLDTIKADSSSPDR